MYWKVNKIFWEQVVFPHYVKETKGVGVDLTLSIPVHGIKYIAIHDCIYESFPETIKGTNFTEHYICGK